MVDPVTMLGIFKTTLWLKKEYDNYSDRQRLKKLEQEVAFIKAILFLFIFGGAIFCLYYFGIFNWIYEFFKGIFVFVYQWIFE